jgi:PAS domain S-box-containing protein
MTSSPHQDNETNRLAALRELEILDTPSEKDFDDLVALAAQICEVPIALITLIDDERQWFKSKYGVGIAETPRSISLCSYAILEEEQLIIPDTITDERFSDNPLVLGPSGIRFYAGIPLRNEEGIALGTLCVMDRKTRTLSESQLSSLKMLANQVAKLIILRLKLIKLQKANSIILQKQLELSNSESKLSAFFNSSSDATFLLDPDCNILSFNKVANENIEKLYSKNISTDENFSLYPCYSSHSCFKESFPKALNGKEIKEEIEISYFGSIVWNLFSFFPMRNDLDEIIGVSFVVTDINDRKRTEEALVASEIRLALVLESTNDGWWDWDIYNNHFYFSSSWSKMLGYEEDEIRDISNPFTELVHPEDKEKVENLFNNFLLDDATHFELEYRILHKGGNYVPIHFKGHILRDFNNMPIRLSGTVSDLSERKRAEEKLAENQRFLQTLIKNLPGYSYRVKNDKDFTPEFISEGVTKITGYETKEYLQDKSITCGREIVDEDKEWVWNKIQDAIFNKKPYELTFRIRTKSGEEKWVWERGQAIWTPSGKLEALEGFVTDITQKKKTEDALKENERILNNIFTVSPVALLISRVSDGMVFMANEGIEKLVGFTTAEFIGQYTPNYYVNIQDRTKLIQEIEKHGSVRNMEVPIRRFDGEVVHCLVSVEIIILDNEPMFLTGFIDIGDRKKVEEKLKKSEQMFSDMAKNVPGVIFQFCVRQDGSTYFSYMSERIYDIFGIQFKSFDDNWTTSIQIPEEDKSAFIDSIRYSITNSCEWKYEGKIICGDGQLKWFEAQSKPFQSEDELIFNGIIIDITERKAAEAALKEREKILWEIFNFSPVPMILSKKESGDIIMVSESIENLIGIPHSSFIGRKAKELYSNPLDRESIKQEVSEKGSIKNKEFLLKRPNGDIVPVLSSVETFYLNNEEMLLTSLIDISERKEIEDALIESEHILQNIFDFSPVPLIISKVSNGLILMANEGLSRLIGIPVSEIIGKLPLDHYVKLEDRIAVMSEIVKKGKIKNYEILFKRNDNQAISCLISTEIIKMKGEKVLLTALVDITERKMIEDALQKSEDNLHTVFENTEVGYILFNENLTILSFNQPAQEFSVREHKKKLAEGALLLDYINEDNQDYIRDAMRLVLGGQTVKYEKYIPYNNGEGNWYFIKYSPVSNKETNVVGFIMAIENISIRKKNELELSRSFELVSQQNKRLLNFSYIVSHNLRSHTSNIISMLDLIQSTNDPDEKEEMIGLLNEVSTSLNETILNLNDVVSIQSNVNIIVEKLQLRTYISKALHVVNDQITLKNASVINNVPDDIFILYNPAYLESVLFNFISNGIKYSHPDRSPIITLDCYKEGAGNVLKITDNGIGIDLKKNGDKIFGMYKTFHGNKDAKGIGLFITKNQIEAMGGKVEVTSEPDKGTTFKLYF